MAPQLKDLEQHAQKNVALQRGHATSPASLHTVPLMPLVHHFDLLGASNAMPLHR